MGAAQRIEGCDFTSLTEKQISILNIHAADCLNEVIQDASIMFACIWCCIKPQADEKGVTQDQFVESIGGPTIIEAREAWIDELSDFIPEIATVLSTMKDAQNRGLKKVKKRSQKMAMQMAERAEMDLDKALNSAEDRINKELMSGQTSG